MPRRRPAAALLLLVALVPGCLSPGPALSVRTYVPAAASRSLGDAPSSPPRLELMRVGAPSYLDLPMVWRLSPVELRRDEGTRWAGAPAELVEDRLRAALYLTGRFEQVTPAVSERAPRLEIEVEAFEGVLDGTPTAHVALVAVHTDDQVRTRVQRFSALEDLENASGAALAAGIGVALDRALADLVRWLGR